MPLSLGRTQGLAMGGYLRGHEGAIRQGTPELRSNGMVLCPQVALGRRHSQSFPQGSMMPDCTHT